MGTNKNNIWFDGFFSPFSADKPNRVVATNGQGYSQATDVTYTELQNVITGGGGNFIENQNGAIQTPAKFSISDSGHIGGYGVTETFVSPQITGHQGYAWDGTYHYIFDTTRIDKRNNDGTWSILLSNTTPFTGVSGTVNHVGDGDYYNGKLYAPVENWGGTCGSSSNQRVVIYNSSTLAFISEFDISAFQTECSSVTIDGVNNIAYTSSYCDSTKIWKYNATTFAFLGTITLSSNISAIQGISFYNNLLYISSESSGIYTVNPSSGDVVFVTAPLASYSISEGMTVIGGQIRLLVDNVGDGTNSNVHFLDPNTNSAVFYTSKTGESYYGSKLQVKDKLSVWTGVQIGSINTETRSGFNTALYIGNRDGVVGSITHNVQFTTLLNNGYFDNGDWRRSDVTKSSFGVFLNNQSNRIEWRSSSASSGPIIWDNRMFLNLAGDLNISSTTSALIATANIATQNAITLKNINSLGASSIVCTDDSSGRTFGLGIKNSASTLDATFGAIGEGFIRAGGSSTGLSISSTVGPIRLLTTTSGTERMRLFANGNFIINGTTDSGFRLDVQGTTRVQNTIDVYGGNGINLFGCDNTSATVRTDATNKAVRIAVPHYLSAQAPMALLNANAVINANTLNIGGGSGILNAATLINFYTATTNATLTGTIAAHIDTNQKFFLDISPNNASAETDQYLYRSSTGEIKQLTNKIFKTKASDPVVADIPAGQYQVYKNTTSGVAKLWMNDGGTLKSVTLT